MKKQSSLKVSVLKDNAGVREAVRRHWWRSEVAGYTQFCLIKLQRGLEALKALDLLPILDKILKDGDEELRHEAVVVLGSRKGVELLVRALKDGNTSSEAMEILMKEDKALLLIRKISWRR